jgi:CBS-domain-containing membrane protein
MGLPVPIRDDRLFVKRDVKPLSEFSRLKKISNDEKNYYQELHNKTAQDHTHVNFVNSTYQDTTADNRKLVFFADEIMSHPVIILSDNISYYEAWHKFQRHKFHHFPVRNKKKQLVGILSDRDMLAHAALYKTETEHHQTIKSMMSKSVVTASPKTSIREICQVMFSQYLGALPITNHRGDLLGIITRSDILKAMAKNEPIELWV